MRRIEALAVLVIVSCAALPAVAQADVLQIGTLGAEWVAGGPATLPAASDLAQVDQSSGVGVIGSTVAKATEQVESTPMEIDSGLHPQSITEALDAAGPTRWRERVAQLAAKYDISPTLLEAVVWQESRWNELALSPVGARGLAQLMPGTAAQMGVDPADPMANLEGGARYLRMQLDAFGGDLEKALAAYNAGPARVLKAGGIPNIRETRAYVASIMARLTDPVRQ
jgi:soluble lytic murein transglycosylase-like protein